MWFTGVFLRYVLLKFEGQQRFLARWSIKMSSTAAAAVILSLSDVLVMWHWKLQQLHYFLIDSLLGWPTTSVTYCYHPHHIVSWLVESNKLSKMQFKMSKHMLCNVYANCIGAFQNQFCSNWINVNDVNILWGSQYIKIF